MFTTYTKHHRFGKRGNPNLSQNGAVLANAFICFFSLLEDIFVTCNLQNDVVLIFSSTFTVTTNGEGQKQLSGSLGGHFITSEISWG